MSPIPFPHATSKLGRLVAAALSILALAPGAQGAAVDGGDLPRLRSEAQRNGAVPVMVHLENVSLERMRSNLPELQAAMRAKAARLMDELGPAAWAAGRWENGVGQIGMHVTPRGLDVLAGSPNALSFFPGKRWNERAPFDGTDGSHAEIERLLALQPYIDVEVTGNIDGLSVEHQRDGTLRFRATPQAVVDAARKLRALLDSATDAEIQNRQSAAAALATSTAGAGALDPRVALRINPRTLLRINRQGLLRLAQHDAVRSVRPIGFADRRERHFDDGLVERASRDGTAEVVISVRNPYAGGLLSRASLEAGQSANRAALLDILADAGVQAPSRDFSRFGAVAARLTSGQLTRLRDSADPRLLAVVENKPVAVPDSGIIAAQIFSFDQARIAEPQSFFIDLLAALQIAADAMVPGAINPLTINMSLSGFTFSAPCTAPEWAAYIAAVQQLRAAGVPVVAATGNNSRDNEIGFPSCMPGVIKVSAVANDGIGNARGFFDATHGANVANPANFPGEDFWLAPGGGNGTVVQSSIPGAWQFDGIAGTSMAAPQIAGLYASAKSADPGLTVDDITAWFTGNAGVNVPMATRAGAPLNFNLMRIRLPAP